jgi:hypothetical protein
MDLINYRRREENGFMWILRYVDHLTGFAHVACLKNKKAATVGRAMVKILSVAVVPDILQSDNGGEFLGQCISYIKKYFPTIKIVKGRARKPSTQGSVERGNGPFKIALENWMQENPNESWSRIGAFVVNASINSRPSTAKSNRSPYKAYYEKNCKVATDSMLDGQLLKESQTEYGLAAVHSVMETVDKKDPSRLIKVEHLNNVIRQADQVFINEDELSSIEKEFYNADAKIKDITDKCVQQIFSTTVTKECTTTPERSDKKRGNVNSHVVKRTLEKMKREGSGQKDTYPDQRIHLTGNKSDKKLRKHRLSRRTK